MTANVRAFTLASAAILLGALGVNGTAHAEYTITFSQDGANVDATGSASIDLTDM